MALPNRKRQRSSELIDPLLARLLSEENLEENALRLGHLALITDDPAHAQILSRHAQCKRAMDLCWSTIGDNTLTAHDEAISILVNLLTSPDTRALVLRGFTELMQNSGSCQMLLVHVDMPVLAHHVVKAVCKCGAVDERDVIQACSFTTASMDNLEDRVDICKAIIGTDGGDNFMFHLLDSWPASLGELRLIETLDWFLTSPVETLMWDAQTRQQDFASAWLRLLCSALMQPEPLPAQALGNTLQIAGAFQEVLVKGSLFEQLVTNLVMGICFNKDPEKLCATMYSVRQLLQDGLVQRLAAHSRFETLVSLVVANLRLATEEQDDVLQVLALLLKNRVTQRSVLAGAGHVKEIIDAISQLLGTAALQDLSLQLFTETLALLTPGALLGAGDSMARLVPQLCSLEEGRRHMESLMLQLQWWPQYVQLVPLGFKAHFAAKQLKVNSDPNPDPVQLEVQREQLLESLCAGLIECTDSLRWGIDVSFTEDEEESGDDKESPSCQRQEFFRLAAAEFMSPELGLFASKDGGRSFHVLPCDESRLAQLELCGKLIGLALLHQDQVPMRLSRPLRRRLLKAPLRPEDIASVDPEFYQKRVLYLLESQYQQEEEPKQLADLGLYFVDEAEAGQKLELCMGGAERPVTEENKMQYLDLLCHHRLLDSVQPQVAALERGMAALVPPEVQERLQRVLSPTELGLLLCGVNELNVEEWKASSRTAPGTSPEIWETFWRAVEAMTLEQQNALLEYATGSCHLPEGLRFTLAPSEGLVPEAVPCFQTLKLPSYASVEDMRSALLGACDR